MKYLKLILAGLLVIITVSQYFIYGFLDMMIVWLVYSLIYLAIGVYQKFHESSVRSQIFTLLYTFVPLAGLVIYEIIAEFISKITLVFYIVFMAALAAALLWEIVSLCLVIKEKRDDHPKRKSPPHTDHGIGTNS